VSDSENEFHEKVLVHHLGIVTVVAPLLGDLLDHLFLAVEGREHTVHAGEQLRVLLLRDSVVLAGALALEQIPELAGDRFKFGLADELPLLGLGNDELQNVIYTAKSGIYHSFWPESPASSTSLARRGFVCLTYHRVPRLLKRFRCLTFIIKFILDLN
jgi:hypothetical protein